MQSPPTMPTLNSQITPLHQCNYLPDRASRLEFIELTEPNSLPTAQFSQFTRQGFRRSGQHLYRPICHHCQRCIATRLPVADFQPNRTQRKLWQKLNNIDIILTELSELNEQHFNLYARYICERHSDGDMYPPSLASFQRFLQFSFTDTFVMEFWQADTLIMVAVCDRLDDGISAVYTFFEPSLPQLSLGTLGILAQIDYVKQHHLDYVYLGFWIPDSDKMQYKANFHPIELLIDRQWHHFDDKVTAQQISPYLQHAIKQHYGTRWQNG
ncbi:MULTISPECIES: arginyltransferase [unclassified Moraxella]|uniref:arginyltransferase n=1 Tax=unclassified Moraxella TaxID=2685852 RepID=UPI003AF7FB62